MNIFKRTLSLFLSMLIVISTVSVIGVTTSAATKEDVYTMELPRAEDKNQEGWGHAAKQYLNGWETHKTEFITVKAVESFEGPSCYCIEPGVSIHTGDTLSKKTESFWDDYPSKYNKTIEPDRIKTFIGRILQYGWTGNNSLEWVSTNEKKADECAQYLATQLLIWETVVGERDESFEKVDASEQGKDNIREVIKSKHPLREKIFEHYRDIAEKVRQHTVVPSFAARSYAKAKTAELEWNGKEYTATLTDSNDVLEAYSFSASGLSFSKSGKKLTITADKAPSSDVKVTIKKIAGKRKAVITWSDSVISPDSNQVQDVVTYGETVTDPVTAYLKIKVSDGSCKIVKTSEDGNVANISFTIKGNGVNSTVKTDSNGVIQIDNLAPGNYTVTEKTLSNYETQESQTVAVVSGKTSTVTFNNKLKRGSLKVTKISEDGLNEGVKFHLYGTSQSGAKVDEYATTDNSGVAEFKNVLIGSDYTLVEADTNIKYVIPENQTVTVEWNKDNNIVFMNKLKKGSVSGKKIDENGNLLSGALIGIFANHDTELKPENAIATAVTLEDGSFSFVNVPYGIWCIREITPPEGYLLNEIVYEVNITENEQIIELEIIDNFIRGNIFLTKVDKDYPNNKLTGAVFEVFEDSNKNGVYDKDIDLSVGNLTETEKGIYTVSDLIYGQYFVKETKAPKDFVLDEGVYPVFISEHGKTYTVENKAGVGFINECMKGGLKIIKTSSDGNVKGFSFRVTGPDSYDKTFKTDKDGIIKIQNLRIGKYTVSEVENGKTKGYILPYDQTVNVKYNKTAKVNMHNKEFTVSPKTGDEGMSKGFLFGLLAIVLGGALASGIMYFKSKKEDE